MTQVKNVAGTNVISQFDYTSDAVGKRTLRIDSSSITNVFKYNLRSELTNAVMNGSTYSWVLDNIGNRITETTNSVTRNFTANSLNQYTQITNGGLKVLLYDLDGNLTNDGVYAYYWDAENRLIAVSNDSVYVQFKYDYMSRRYEKISGTTTTKFIWDGWNCISEASSDTTNYYTWGIDLSGSLQGAGGIGGLLSVSSLSSTSFASYFPFCDANGNITDYITADGAVVAHRAFDAYGNTVASSGPKVNELKYWFSSKYLDEETGLYYYGYRYYSPMLERWLNRDPIGERGGWNLVSILYNNCIDQVDGFGLAACDAAVTVPIRYDFKVDPPRIPSVPGVSLYIEGKARIEVDVITQDCRKCCSNGSVGKVRYTKVRGFVRGGMVATWGGKGDSPIFDDMKISYWYGIRAEISMQVQLDSTWAEDSCQGEASPIETCFGYKALGRVSGGAQARLVVGRWGVGTLEATINGEVTQEGSVCIKCDSQGCSFSHRFDVTKARAYARFCLGSMCASPCLLGDCSGMGGDTGT